MTRPISRSKSISDRNIQTKTHQLQVLNLNKMQPLQLTAFDFQPSGRTTSGRLYLEGSVYQDDDIIISDTISHDFVN
jgi:hypothetical protein